MFRLYRAELKKIFLKPSIFVVTGLIILMLALSTFLYNPSAKSTFIVDYNRFNTSLQQKCDTVQEVYDCFVNNDLDNYSKFKNDQLLVSANNYIKFYKTNGNNLEKLNNLYDVLSSKLTIYQTSFSAYQNAYSSNNEVDIASTKNNLDIARNNFFIAHENFNDTYNRIVKNEQTTVLVTSALDKKMYNHYSKYEKSNYENNTSLGYYENNYNYINKLFPSASNPEFLNTLRGYLDQIKLFKVDNSIFDNLSSYITMAQDRLGNDGSNGGDKTGLFATIYNFYQQYKTSESAARAKDLIALITDYNLTAEYTNYYVTNSIKVNGLEKLGATNIQTYIPFQNSNLYQLKEKVTKTNFLLMSNTYEYQYADVFSIAQPSNENINGYDYSYFALRLCTLFIIVYIVVLAASTIAGEQSAGTMKLLAIRPYSRNKLLTSKILAILTIGAILLAVCSSATLAIGGITYGFQSAYILGVFNATSFYVLSPFMLYIIAFVTMLTEIFFYAILSVFISTVFKSNVGAVTVSILLFFVSLVLNIVAVNVPILRFLPFTNINTFKYWGGSFLATNSAQSVLQGILTPTVFVGATAYLSNILLDVTFIILMVVSYITFNKQDIK